MAQRAACCFQKLHNAAASGLVCRRLLHIPPGRVRKPIKSGVPEPLPSIYSTPLPTSPPLPSPPVSSPPLASPPLSSSLPQDGHNAINNDKGMGAAAAVTRGQTDSQPPSHGKHSKGAGVDTSSVATGGLALHGQWAGDLLDTLQASPDEAKHVVDSLSDRFDQLLQNPASLVNALATAALTEQWHADIWQKTMRADALRKLSFSQSNLVTLFHIFIAHYTALEGHHTFEPPTDIMQHAKRMYEREVAAQKEMYDVLTLACRAAQVPYSYRYIHPAIARHVFAPNNSNLLLLYDQYQHLQETGYLLWIVLQAPSAPNMSPLLGRVSAGASWRRVAASNRHALQLDGPWNYIPNTGRWSLSHRLYRANLHRVHIGVESVSEAERERFWHASMAVSIDVGGSRGHNTSQRQNSGGSPRSPVTDAREYVAQQRQRATERASGGEDAEGPPHPGNDGYQGRVIEHRSDAINMVELIRFLWTHLSPP